MKKILLSGISILIISSTTFSQTAVEKENKANYSLAARFSPNNLKKMIFSTTVNPNWLKSGKFWYSYNSPDMGTMWYIVEPDRQQKNKLFDNADLAAKLSLATKNPQESKHLELKGLKFSEDENRLLFEVNSTMEVLMTPKERKESKSKIEE